METLKQEKYEELKNKRNQVLTILYAGFLKNEKVESMHKKVRSIITPHTSPVMYYNSMRLLAKVNRDLKKEKKDISAELVFVALMVKNSGFTFLQKNVYKELNDFETKEKEKELNDLSLSALKSQRIFYICSSHADCAKDHVAFQGKIYIDKFWKRAITKKHEREIIENYLATHKTLTMQEVTMKPVWLVTRPNCRHFFKTLSVMEVLGEAGLEELLNKYHMKFQQGDRQFTQTMAHSLKSEWYKRNNIENIIKKYQERLECHASLVRVKSTPLLQNAMEKDKFLIKKWKTYLQKNF